MYFFELNSYHSQLNKHFHIYSAHRWPKEPIIKSLLHFPEYQNQEEYLQSLDVCTIAKRVFVSEFIRTCLYWISLSKQSNKPVLLMTRRTRVEEYGAYVYQTLHHLKRPKIVSDCFTKNQSITAYIELLDYCVEQNVSGDNFKFYKKSDKLYISSTI